MPSGCLYIHAINELLGTGDVNAATSDCIYNRSDSDQLLKGRMYVPKP